MWEFFARLFDTSGFPPRWYCGSAWQAEPGVGWLHIVSDVFVFGAYVAIPCVLLYFIRRRPDAPFPRVFFLFGAFIFACGTGHLVESTLFWWPAYRFSGLLKLTTAVVSWATVFALVPIVPQALALPGLARLNEQLRIEVDQRRVAEDQLRRFNESLEEVVVQNVDALRKSEAQLRLAQRTADLGTWEYHTKSRKLICSDELLDLYGLPRDHDVLDLADWLQIVHEADRHRAANDLKRAAGREGPYESEFRVIRPDGAVRRILAQGGAVSEGFEGSRIVIGVNIDVTHRRELEEAIAEQVAGEQQRISQELHDGLGQQLTGLGFLAKSLHKSLEQEGSRQAPQAKEVADIIPDIVRNVRAIVRGLMPVEIDTVGLMAALDQLATNTAVRSGVACTFRCDNSVFVDDGVVSTHLFRIAQEAVNNAVKHARAEQITIDLEQTGSRLQLTVRDDGIGLPADAHQREGMGLRILRHRASLIGANLNVDAAKNGGTEITCQWQRKP